MRRIRLRPAAAARPAVRPSRRRSATACVEFALVLPVLLTFLLGVLEIGRYIEVRLILTQAAREGARQASTGQMTNTQVVAAVTGCVAASGLSTTGLTVSVQDLTSLGTDVSLATTMDNLQVTASIPYVNVRWCPTTMFTTSSTIVEATAYWISSNPQSYPTNITAPAGS
jgi:Flp pilus assembly protein TadG